MVQSKLTYESHVRYEDDQAIIDRLTSKGWTNHGVPAPPAPDPVQEEANRVKRIKFAAGQLIESYLPAWKQRNLLARFSELIDLGNLTTEQQAEKDAITAVWSWVKSVRSESDRLEADESLFVEDADWPVFGG